MGGDQNFIFFCLFLLVLFIGGGGGFGEKKGDLGFYIFGSFFFIFS